MKKLIPVGLVLLGAFTALTAQALVQVKTFPDVNYSDYYGNGVTNMVGQGFVTGYANGNFGPNDSVTRAQLVTILDRYDKKVENMKVMICDGTKREDVANKHIYDELCPSVLQ